MENQQRDIENDLETTSAAPDDVAFAIEEFTVGQFVYVEYDDQNYPQSHFSLGYPQSSS
jgi:hypothetical protein